jgi:recombinational DNA repair protein (RecF pathway)
MTTIAEDDPDLIEVPSGETDECLLCKEPLQVYFTMHRGHALYEQCYSAADIANGLKFVGCTHEVW